MSEGDTSSARFSLEKIKVFASGPFGFFVFIGLLLEVGLGATLAATAQDTTERAIIAAGCLLILALMVVIVGISLLRHPPPSGSAAGKGDGETAEGATPGHGTLIEDERATADFFSGGKTKILAGAWEVTWYEYDEEGNKKLYQLESLDGTKEDCPPNSAQVWVQDAMLSVRAQDVKTHRAYYMEGRLSDDNVATLLYWSNADTTESHLVGVLVLEVKKTRHFPRMEGQWMGHARHKGIVHGFVEWQKVRDD